MSQNDSAGNNAPDADGSTDSKPDWESLARAKYASEIEYSAGDLVRDGFSKVAVEVRRGEPAVEEILQAHRQCEEALETYVVGWARRGEGVDSDVLHALEVGTAVMADFVEAAKAHHEGTFGDDDLACVRRGIEQAERLLDEWEEEGGEDDDC